MVSGLPTFLLCLLTSLHSGVARPLPKADVKALFTAPSSIIASYSAQHNAKNLKNTLYKERIIEPQSPWSADRMWKGVRGSKRHGIESVNVIRQLTTEGGSKETATTNTNRPDIYTSEAGSMASVTADRKRRGISTEADRGSPESVRVKRGDIYALIDSELRKRHKLESDEDMRRLLAALNTIRDILETGTLPSQLLNPTKPLTNKPLPSLFRGPPTQKSLPNSLTQKSNTARIYDLRNKLSAQTHSNNLRNKPYPHPNDPRNKQLSLANHQGGKPATPAKPTFVDESSGSLDNVERSRLALRTGSHDGGDKSPYYHGFNPTGW